MADSRAAKEYWELLWREGKLSPAINHQDWPLKNHVDSKSDLRSCGRLSTRWNDLHGDHQHVEFVGYMQKGLGREANDVCVLPERQGVATGTRG